MSYHKKEINNTSPKLTPPHKIPAFLPLLPTFIWTSCFFPPPPCTLCSLKSEKAFKFFFSARFVILLQKIFKYNLNYFLPSKKYFFFRPLPPKHTLYKKKFLFHLNIKYACDLRVKENILLSFHLIRFPHYFKGGGRSKNLKKDKSL